MKQEFELFDGAFGTYYYKKTLDNGPCEIANLKNPEAVMSIHLEYVTAGVDAIKTNTFAVNSSLFSKEEKEEIIIAGFDIACRAAGDKVQVFADIGPCCIDDAMREQEYLQTAVSFLDAGAQCFLFETFGEFQPLELAVAYIKKKKPDAKIYVSFAVSQDGYSKKGHYYKSLILRAADNKNVDAVGLNCICGPVHLYHLIADLNLPEKKFLAMPNSGYPSMLNERVVFRDNAQYYGEKLRDIYSLGVHILGGCCGTTPKHIRLALEIMKAAQIEGLLKTIVPKAPASASVQKRKTHAGCLKKKFLIEISPPFDTDCSFALTAAEKLKQCGVDVVTVCDSPLSRTRADSVMTAAKIKRETGVEVLPHISCRDKNQIGLKATLLGASFEHINQVLIVTGDPVIETERGGQRGVFSLNSYGLIGYLNSMNQDVFKNQPFMIGGALNVNALRFDTELSRAKKKIEGGASFLMSQPIFTQQAVDNFLRAAQELDAKLYAGILPVVSYKNALFLNNEVSGVEIPDNVIKNLMGKTQEEVFEISLEFSMSIVNQVYAACEGFYLMTPMKKVDLICRLMEKIRDRKE